MLEEALNFDDGSILCVIVVIIIVLQFFLFFVFPKIFAANRQTFKLEQIFLKDYLFLKSLPSWNSVRIIANPCGIVKDSLSWTATKPWLTITRARVKLLTVIRVWKPIMVAKPERSIKINSDIYFSKTVKRSKIDLLFGRIIWTIVFEKLFSLTFFSLGLIRCGAWIYRCVKNNPFRTCLQVRSSSPTIPKLLAWFFCWPSKESICSRTIFWRLCWFWK